MMRVICLIFLLVLATAEEIKPQYSNGTNDYIISSLNDLVDESIPYISKLIKRLNLDPARVPDANWNFTVKGLFNTYKGTVGLNEGRLYDLSTIKRSGNVTIYYKDKHLRFEVGFGFNGLSIYSKYGFRFGFFGHSGMVKGQVLDINAKLILDFNMNEYDLSLWKFKMYNKMKFRVKLYGNRLLDWIATPISNFFLNVFSDDVISLVEKKVTKVVQTKLDIISSNFPRLTRDLLEQDICYDA